MKKPLVSVLIPCYNCEKYVEEAVRSIMNQTYTELEIICINDGSTDHTTEILNLLSNEDNRIKYIENQVNIKLIATLNKGLQLCNGRYIARMDADDISLPERIEKQVDFLEQNPDYGIVGTYVQLFGLSDKRWNEETENNAIKGALYRKTTFAHPTVLMRKSVIDDNKLHYKTDYLHAEDYKLWCDFSPHTKMANLPEILLNYRITDNQISSKYIREQEECTAKIRREMIDKLLHPIGIMPHWEKVTSKDIENLYSVKEKIDSHIFHNIEKVFKMEIDALWKKRRRKIKNFFKQFLGLKKTY